MNSKGPQNWLINLVYQTSLLALLIMVGCANPVAPTGGPKDTTPPKIDSLLSTPNFSTNFKGREFRLKFNEWISVDNISKDLVISPPLNKPPKVIVKGKEIRFVFDETEVLQANTTYSIQMGDGIKDLTENNAIKDYRFVFSTGEKIDQAKISGKVIDAYSGEKNDGFLVLLHSDMNDSAFLKKRPDYFTKTDKEGNFNLSNIRPGNFKLFVLKDENSNYKYDQDNELIGFVDSIVSVRADSTLSLSAIKSSRDEKPSKLVEKKFRTKGVIKVGFSGDPKSVQLKLSDEKIQYLTEYDRDTLFLWYKQNLPNNWQLFLDNGSKVDTITIDTSRFVPDKQYRNLVVKSNSRSKFQSKILLTDNILASFNSPIVNIDTSKIMLLEDSLSTRNFKVIVSPDHPRRIEISSKWKEASNYKVILQPGALKDWFNNSNDTIKLSSGIANSKELGNLNFHIKTLKKEVQYLIKITNSSNETLKEYTLVDQSEWNQKLSNMLPGLYSVYITIDKNKNGKWDTINLKQKRQPEEVFIFRSEPLKPNWELDVNIAL